MIAIGGACGAGIGGGCRLGNGIVGQGTNISISGSANVKAAGGVGDSMRPAQVRPLARADRIRGQLLRRGLRTPPVCLPTAASSASDPGTTFDIPQPKPRSSFPKPAPDPVAVEEEPQPVKAALYRVIDDAGKPLPVETKQEDGVLLLTAEADIAILEGAISGLQTLQSRGIDTITFTNGTISVSFSLAEVIAKGASSDVYRLTLSGGEADFHTWLTRTSPRCWASNPIKTARPGHPKDVRGNLLLSSIISRRRNGGSIRTSRCSPPRWAWTNPPAGRSRRWCCGAFRQR